MFKISSISWFSTNQNLREKSYSWKSLNGWKQYGRKKPTSENWPVITGDYIVGDPESPVAVATLASHIEEIPSAAGAAIAGPCKTENLGIEKVVANIISNPNIRFLMLCGAEVQGHITGQSIQALYENGCDEEKKRIIGATGAIPYVENLPMDAIERFQNQVEIIDLIDNEDSSAISTGVKELIEKDPGALEEEPIIFKIDEKKIDLKIKETNKIPSIPKYKIKIEAE